MQYLAAPMEGLTGVVWRQVHRRLFSGIDAYYTPFVSPTQNRCFPSREERDIDPLANEGLPVVPQVLVNRPELFLWAAGELRRRGYGEINLNLGCPSCTVTAKRKGAGFLSDPVALEAFFEDVFADGEPALSVKTRLGRYALSEWAGLMELYNAYPLTRLIVHPRLPAEGYGGQTHGDAFRLALKESHCPVTYNGNIHTAADAARVIAAYPGTASLMLGRGLMADPALARHCRGGPALTGTELRDYTGQLYEAFRRYYPDARAAVGRMKEHWRYLRVHFPGCDRPLRQLQKAETAAELETAMAAIWRDCPFVPAADGWEEQP